MKLKILGTRGEIEESLPYHAKHSGVLIDDELLLDIGEKSFLALHPRWIFITHLHPDHAYFVRWGQEETPSTDAQIYAPEKPENEQASSVIRLIDQPIQVGPYSIIPIPTHHSKRVKSQGYLVKKGALALLYTGDLVWIDKAYHSLFDHLDLVITEASFMRKGGMIRKDKETGALYGHTGIPNLLDLFKPYTKQILFLHFGAWFYKDTKASRQALSTLAQEKDMKAIIGYDGLELDLGRIAN
ncbi:MBL fold metallo-hydrolase [Candidatus Protochlamydia phocaeensis]|uniref:MBL fold metallo-hydrolase n=1 Tax=Candidatus Protochlamydia phocaeensis TaxID=1414722 RepID=UPI000838A503|nr:MBL fold metallo-hydrolase [Candidatus Protochlamydia phocaeensis]